MVENIVMPAPDRSRGQAPAGIQVCSDEIKQAKTGFPLARE
jgi:hypothetical protein